jgi:hypothetical protein
MNKILLFSGLIINLLCAFSLSAQDLPKQTIKGVVIDRDSKKPLELATVQLLTTEPQMGIVTDENGKFRFENVPTGRHSLQVQFFGYETYISENIIVNSAKELVLTIELSETAFTSGEVVVTDSTKKQHRTLNDMTTVSGRSFSAEETQRYAGSINDPSRMAMGFAGVQANRDNNSDIVVRGNSPIGVLWRLEGIDIPNPNHFARRGSSGGGITIFSASLLGNSDFSTGAFAPEYGNAFSSVFDMRFRKGNNEKREYTIRVGLIGLDASTEGYFKKGEGSYLVNYRYSTLGILNKLGVRLVGERIDNNFQDLSFNLHFPTKGRKHSFSLFGIGGLSAETGDAQPDTTAWREYNDRYQYYFSTNMFATGLTHTVTLNDKSYLRTTLAVMASDLTYDEDTVNTAFSPTRISAELHNESRITLATTHNHKFNSRITLKSGLFLNQMFFKFSHDKWNYVQNRLVPVITGSGNTQLIQVYSQAKIKITPRLSTVVGFHAMLLTLNATYSVEPRVAFQYALKNGHSLSFGYGLHSRMQPLGTYFTQVYDSFLTDFYYVNKNLPLLQAHHLVLGYDWYGAKGWHVRAELYAQQLTNVPVGASQDSTFWVLNARDGFAQEKLYATGKGQNYGVDLTVEKFFANQFFILASGAYYRSLATALDGNTYSSRFDGIFNTSLMAGKEFSFKKGGTLQLGTRIIASGGYRYTPADAAASQLAGELVLDTDRINEAQIPTYFRIDGRVSYRKNAKKVAYTIALDVQNATARRNVRDQIYDPATQTITFSNQSGLVPVLSFQLDF